MKMLGSERRKKALVAVLLFSEVVSVFGILSMVEQGLLYINTWDILENPMFGKFEKKQENEKYKEPNEAKISKDSNLQAIRKTMVAQTSKNATCKGPLSL